MLVAGGKSETKKEQMLSQRKDATGEGERRDRFAREGGRQAVAQMTYGFIAAKMIRPVTSGRVWNGGMLGTGALITYSCPIKHDCHCRTFDQLSYRHLKATFIAVKLIIHSLQTPISAQF